MDTFGVSDVDTVLWIFRYALFGVIPEAYKADWDPDRAGRGVYDHYAKAGGFSLIFLGSPCGLPSFDHPDLRSDFINVSITS